VTIHTKKFKIAAWDDWQLLVTAYFIRRGGPFHEVTNCGPYLVEDRCRLVEGKKSHVTDDVVARFGMNAVLRFSLYLLYRSVIQVNLVHIGSPEAMVISMPGVIQCSGILISHHP